MIIVLGAAFVALICDFLKGANERLREANIELRVRDHERERHLVYLERTHRYAAEEPSPFLEEFAEPEPQEAAEEAEPAFVASVPMPLEPVAAEPAAVRETIAETAAFAPPPTAMPAVELTTSAVEAPPVQARVEPPAEAYEPPPVELQAPLEVGAAAGAPPESLPVPVEAVLNPTEPSLPAAPAVVSGGEPLAIEIQAPLRIDAATATGTAGGAVLAAVPPLEAPPAAAHIPALAASLSGQVLSEETSEPPLHEQAVPLSVAPAASAPQMRVAPEVPWPATQAETLYPVASVPPAAPASLPDSGTVELRLQVSDAPSAVAPILAGWVAPEAGTASPALAANLDATLDLPAPAGQLPLILSACDMPLLARALDVAPLPMEIDLHPPVSETPAADVLEPVAAALEEVVPAEPVSNAIRIRVLTEEAVLPPSESLWLEAEPQLAVQQVRIDLLPVPPIPSEAVMRQETLESVTLVAPEPLLPAESTLPEPAVAFSAVLFHTEVHPLPAPPSRFRVALVPQFTLEAPPEIPVADLADQPLPAARGVVVEMPPPPPRPDAVLGIPGGLQEASVLGRLVAHPEPFHGLVVSVSLFEYGRLVAEQGRATIDALVGSVELSLLSLMRESDFICRSAEDEFILLFPRETGPSAQRRITQISERLWDFQLRSLGTMSVFFSWGASESDRAPLNGLVHQAREQMLETRRTRRGAINLAPKTGRRAHG